MDVGQDIFRGVMRLIVDTWRIWHSLTWSYVCPASCSVAGNKSVSVGYLLHAPVCTTLLCARRCLLVYCR